MRFTFGTCGETAEHIKESEKKRCIEHMGGRDVYHATISPITRDCNGKIASCNDGICNLGTSPHRNVGRMFHSGRHGSLYMHTELVRLLKFAEKRHETSTDFSFAMA